ncbi:MAG TPA: DUF6371 domain-containing protein [Rectinema sp.]|nr:DUF6371 domain-containing protein [Rectinema sp.]
MEHYYSLAKYRGKSSRLACPNCGKRFCFTPYVDPYGNILSEECGRCDHESSCGYHFTPHQYFQQHPEAKPQTEDWRKEPEWLKKQQYRPKIKQEIKTKPVTLPATGISTIPMETVLKTVRTKPVSDFLFYLCNLFDVDTILRLVREYLIGVTKAGDVIFYQIDRQGRCRTGKVMKYDRITGHRIKDEDVPGKITWVHSLLSYNGQLPDKWELTQCIFGEHLLRKHPESPVILVEAEKTAVIGAGYFPDYVWVALGGKKQFGDKVDALVGRKVLAFPDIDAYDCWRQEFEKRPYLSVKVSDLLIRQATPEDYEKKIDVADLLIRHKQSEQSFLVPKPQAPPPKELYSDNPVMQEVMKYISPENWANMDALIRDLDLELAGVTRMMKIEE